jgi:diketogulonate reductase-like aldo/keto reductase
MQTLDRTLSIGGMQVPRFFYGTAWKEDDTERLTALALRGGFRGIDTANQRRHYDEASVGRAVSASIASGMLARDELRIIACPTTQRRPYPPK